METNLPLPRGYGFAYRPTDDVLIFIAPEKFPRGQCLLDSYALIRAGLRQLRGDVLADRYNPIIVTPNVLDVSESELMKTLREGIHQTHGTYNLLTTHGDRAVREIDIKTNTVRAQVKRVTDGRRRGAYSDCWIRDPRRLSCCMPGDYYSRGKDFWVGLIKEPGMVSDKIEETRTPKVFDIYLAALSLALSDEPSFENIIPVDLDSNPYLVSEVLAAYYIEGQSLFEISRKLMGIRGFVNDDVIEAVRDGKVGIEVLRQKYMETDKNLGFWKAVRDVVRDTKILLRENGFIRRGHVLEYPNKPKLMAVCTRFVREDGIIADLYIHPGIPPLIIYRYPQPEDVDSFNFYGGGYLYTYPLKILNRKVRARDDYSRRMMDTRIITPSSLGIKVCGNLPYPKK